MRKILKYMVVAIAATIFSSCDSNTEPDMPEMPDDKAFTFNKNDSAAFCEILRKAQGDYLETYLELNGMRLDDIKSWSGVAGWTLDTVTREARISYLWIIAPSEDLYENELSYRITELDSLSFLRVEGTSLHGSFPRRKDCKSILTDLCIRGTSIEYIPDEVFLYPKLRQVTVWFNYKMLFPKGMLKRENFEQDKYYPLLYSFDENGFTGVCPIVTSLNVSLMDNDFTSINWDGIKEKDFKAYFRSQNFTGPNLNKNKITGKIPDYVLADTLATIYVYNKAGIQQPGYGLENMPSDEEIQKMKEEYKKNHPEEVKDYRLF